MRMAIIALVGSLLAAKGAGLSFMHLMNDICYTTDFPHKIVRVISVNFVP